METDIAIDRVLRRRSEIAGRLEHLELQVSGLQSDLRHLDAALRILGYTESVLGAPARRSCAAGLFRPKELPRLVTAHLRANKNGLKARDIALLISDDKGWALTDAPFQEALSGKIARVLGLLKNKGYCELEGRKAGYLWRAVKPLSRAANIPPKPATPDAPAH